MDSDQHQTLTNYDDGNFDVGESHIIFMLTVHAVAERIQAAFSVAKVSGGFALNACGPRAANM